MASASSRYFEQDEDFVEDGPFEAARGFEADESDEADEADETDEDYESDESSASVEADETDEAVEADEADEDYESDEANSRVHQTPSYAAARTVQQRQRNWEQRVRAVQSADARQALANQRTLNRRIQNATRTRLQTVPSMKGANMVTLQLPGRPPLRAYVRGVASTEDVRKLRDSVRTNTSRLKETADKLSNAQSAAVKAMTTQINKNSLDLSKKLIEGDNALSKLIAKESAERKVALEKHAKSLARASRHATKSQMGNFALLGTMIPLWALYADRQDLLARRNLYMLGSNVFWFLSDEILGKIIGQGKIATQNMSWLAVAGNIATMMFIAKDDQIERFVTVVKTLPAATGATALAAPLTLSADDLGIRKDYKETFEGLNEVRAVATYIQPVTVPTGTTLPATVGMPSVHWDKSAKSLIISGVAGQQVAVLVDTWEKGNADL